MTFSNVYRPNFLEIFGEMLKQNFLYLHELYSLGMVNKAICIGSFYNEKLLRFLLSFNYNQDNPNCPRGIATRICPWHANLGTFEEKNNTVYYRWVKTPKTPQDLHLIIQDQTKKLKQKYKISDFAKQRPIHRLDNLKIKMWYLEDQMNRIKYQMETNRTLQRINKEEIKQMDSQLPFTETLWEHSYEQKAFALRDEIHDKARKFGPTFRGHKGMMKKLRVLSNKFTPYTYGIIDRFPTTTAKRAEGTTLNIRGKVADIPTVWNTLPLKNESQEDFVKRVNKLYNDWESNPRSDPLFFLQ